MGFPRIVIDLGKIEGNTGTVCELAGKQGIEVTGVTKATCGDPRVGKAMLKGGAVSLADSRIENLKRLKKGGIGAELVLLRTPMPSQVSEVVRYADVSLNSELEVMRLLSEEWVKGGKKHRVVIMAEMGELREGATEDELDLVITGALDLEGLELRGIGMNLACLSGVVPTPEKMREFDALVEKLEKNHGIEFEMIGGGNSANIPLLLEGWDGGRTNNLRIGEGILLGLETVKRTAIPGTYQDAFLLEAEIIELKEKPSVPSGMISENAFGERPEFEDSGRIQRAVLALGRQDVRVEGLKPLDHHLSIIGSSSDHVVLNMEGKYRVGDTVKFAMDYGALVSAFTSPYMDKVYK